MYIVNKFCKAEWEGCCTFLNRMEKLHENEKLDKLVIYFQCGWVMLNIYFCCQPTPIN